MPALPSVPNAFTWRLIGIIAVAALVLGHAQGFSLRPRPLLFGGAIFVGMLAMAHFYTAWRPSPDLAVPLMLPAFFVATMLVFGPFSYLTASLNRPLFDVEFATADAFFGFDWVALHHFVAGRPWLARAANLTYAAGGLQMFILWAVLASTRQHERLAVMLATTVMSLTAVMIIAGLLPAAGAYAHYGIAQADLGFLGDGAGKSYLADFRGVRDGTLRFLDVSKTAGICQFPSFHTVMALLSAWAGWRTRWIRWPSAALSVGIVLTTMPVGGHHMVDVLGGIAILVATLAIAVRVQARQGRGARVAHQAVTAAA